MNPDSPRDQTFARFAFAVITVALVVVVLGLTGIYYYFQSGGSGNPENPMANLFKRKTAGGLAPNQVMLYYTSDGKQLVATVADAGTVNMFPAEKARKIVESLLAGKDAAGLKSPIPPGTTIVNVFLKDNIAIVNLSREFMTELRGGVDAEMLAIYSVVNSLLFNLEGIDAVQILIDGERVPTLGGSLDINEPLIANTAITRTS